MWFPRARGIDWTGGFPLYLVPRGEAKSKEQAVHAIVRRLVENGILRESDRAKIVSAVMKRESLGSTGIGRGVAIPHATYGGVSSLVGALGKFADGVEFDAVDGEPCHLICLLIAPVEKPGDHMRALEAVARHLRASL